MLTDLADIVYLRSHPDVGGNAGKVNRKKKIWGVGEVRGGGGASSDFSRRRICFIWRGAHYFFIFFGLICFLDLQWRKFFRVFYFRYIQENTIYFACRVHLFFSWNLCYLLHYYATYVFALLLFCFWSRCEIPRTQKLRSPWWEHRAVKGTLFPSLV